MSVKQDGAAPRTVADIEQKYNFGKSFAEIMGLIDDTRNEVDTASSELVKMSVKQDRAAPRTVADIERKYNFGKSFAEIMGLIDDTRNEVDTASSELRDEIEKTSISIRRDTEKIVIEATKSIDRVETKTGYVFDSNGLNISKTGEEMSNLLDNTGMYVKRSEENILVANNEGVTATDLHAKTYLKIGSGEGRCRFEDYGTDRIGCFWTGG